MQNRKVKAFIAVLTIVVIVCIIWYKHHERHLRKAEKEAKEHRYRYLDIHPEYTQTDVKSLINISSVTDIKEKRAKLIRFIWGREVDLAGIKLKTNKAEDGEADKKFIKYKNIKKYIEGYENFEEVNHWMDYGLRSTALYLIPEKPCGKLLVYHQGHRGNYVKKGVRR
jgi:hypothetical protein